jgi:hypothetical protein
VRRVVEHDDSRSEIDRAIVDLAGYDLLDEPDLPQEREVLRILTSS